MGDADGEGGQAPELPDASPLGQGGAGHPQTVAPWQGQVTSTEGFHGVVEGGVGGDLDHVLQFPLGHPLGVWHQLFPTSLIHHPQPRPGTQAQFFRRGLLGHWEGVEQVAQGGWKALGGQRKGGMVFCHGSRLTILPHPMTACPVVCKDFPKCKRSTRCKKGTSAKTLVPLISRCGLCCVSGSSSHRSPLLVLPEDAADGHDDRKDDQIVDIGELMTDDAGVDHKSCAAEG